MKFVFATIAIVLAVQTATAEETIGVCGLTFQLPKGWDARPSPYEDDNPCSVCLLPDDWRKQWNDAGEYDLGECAFVLTVIAGDLETAAPETYFEKHEGRWFVAGRMSALSETEPLVLGEWVGIQGFPLVRKESKLGGMVPGLGEVFRLFVAHPCGSSVFLEGDGPPDGALLRALFAASR
jgi:hypothetical protein